METQNYKITITALEEKNWKGRQFVVVQTKEQGELSCWSAPLFSLLSAAKNSKEVIDVELAKTAKGKMVINGIAGVESSAKVGSKGIAIGAAMDRKENSIKGFTAQKNSAITEASIRRDSMMMVFAEMNGKQPNAEALKLSLEGWTSFFKHRYESNE